MSEKSVNIQKYTHSRTQDFFFFDVCWLNRKREQFYLLDQNIPQFSNTQKHYSPKIRENKTKNGNSR